MLNISLSNGSSMPALGMGTYLLKDKACIEATRTALRVGYRHIDTAQIYGNEAEVGTGIQESDVSRSDIFLTTKVWTDKFHQGDLEKSVDESLVKLKTDYVDLLLLHWPNPAVPLAETLEAINRVLKAGKTKAIGVSNFTVALMEEAVKLSEAPIVNNQVEYHVLLSQKAVLGFAIPHNIAITAYSPLAQGRLREQPILEEIGKKYGKTAPQVALRWLAQQHNVAAIPKASSEKNLKLNFEIFDFALSEEDLQKINTLQGNNRINSFDFSPVWDK
jgi:diketogulonate reductase-like aldo/keto reductase